MIFLIIFLSLTQSIYSYQSIKTEQATQISAGQTNLVVQLFYEVNISPNVTKFENVTVYRNSAVSGEFIANNKFVSCSNMDLFILNQTNLTNQTNKSSEYFLLLYNYTKAWNITIQTDNNEGKVYQNVSCPINTDNICNISINASCITDTYSFNLMTVTILNFPQNNTNTIFQYNQVCNPNEYQYFIQIQWGTVIIVIYSICMIYVTSKFQQAKSFSNIVFYINYIPVILYCLISLITFVLIYQQVPHSQEALQIFYIIISIVFGIIGIIVCCSQFLYVTRIKIFRSGYYNGKIRFRVMDSIGFCLAIGLFFGWQFDDHNWIISNIIFTCIFITLIKIIKLGSLKIALIIFVCNLIISLSFGNTVQIMNSTYTNYNFYAFNNPLFFLVPMITKIPNRKCAWHFIFEMAYPGLLLAYLERFDKNRSSVIYSTTFIISYILCTVLWYVVNYLVPIALPFDLFTVPISMIFIILFSNRRGQLGELWSGQFYDQQKSYYQNQKQIMQKLTQQKTGTFNSRMFQNLRFNKDVTDDESQGSNFTEIIKKIQVDKLAQNKNAFYLSQLPMGKKKKSNKEQSKNKEKQNFTNKSQSGDSKPQNVQMESQITSSQQNRGI